MRRSRRGLACGNIRSVTAQPNAHVRFRRAIERRALWLAEDAARELPNLSLSDALQLIHLYAERGSPKYEKAARRWLERYITEQSPTLQRYASGGAGAGGTGAAVKARVLSLRDLTLVSP